MVEVEKKCHPTNEFLKILKSEAEKLGECVCKDICLDFPDLRLIINDIWLRNRNGKYELKIPIPGEKKSDVYEEIENDERILEKLKLKNFDDLIELTTLVTHRQKFKVGEFHIDLDEITSPGSNFSYSLMEIELMVESTAQYEDAQQKILKFMQEHSIKNEVVNGKWIEYVKNYRPELFKVMKQSPNYAERVH